MISGVFEYILGSIISVVGKTTVEIIELFECTQLILHYRF